MEWMTYQVVRYATHNDREDQVLFEFTATGLKLQDGMVVPQGDGSHRPTAEVIILGSNQFVRPAERAQRGPRFCGECGQKKK